MAAVEPRKESTVAVSVFARAMLEILQF